MASPSVTYTFANSTTADATQVNQNFTDLINGASDGTKDYSINALTCGGTATFNGDVNLGNSSSDTFSLNAALGSSILIKTQNSYDLGAAALAFRSLYLASADGAGRGTRIIGAIVASNWTFTLPTGTGTAGQILSTDGTGVSNWATARTSPFDVTNYSLATAVAASALTITLNDASGSAPSTSSPVAANFRSATANAGTISNVVLSSGAITLVVPSSATLGHANAINQYIYVYLINNAGTMELACSSVIFEEGAVVSTTAMSSGSTSNRVMYSTTARTSVACRLIGRLLSNQTTAGTWAANMTQVTAWPFNIGAISARFKKTSAQSVANNTSTTWTISSVDFDTMNARSGDTYVCVRAGIYRISGVTSFASNATGTRFLYVAPNGVASAYLMVQQGSASGASDSYLSGTGIYKASAGDTLELQVVQNSGGSLNVGTDNSGNFFEIEYIGPSPS